MSIAIAVSVSIVLVAAVWLVYLNRGSEKIVSAAVPIAAASLLALGLSVFVFGADSSTTVRFISAYTLVTSTKKPEPKVVICKQNGEFSLDAMNWVIASHPEVLKNPNDSNAIQLYNHLLQWEIMRRMSLMFGKHWQTEVVNLSRYNTRYNNVEAGAGDAEILSSDKIHTILKDNKFVLYSSVYDGVFPFQIALPPHTTVNVTAPKDSFKENENSGVIRFSVDNMPVLGPAYIITITTRPLATGQGSSGYKKYAGLSADQDRSLFTYLYEVNITTESSRIRSGSPSIIAYKRWVDRMIDALRDQLDDERLFEKNRRDGCILTNGQ
jgi:hypothetical protein